MRAWGILISSIIALALVVLAAKSAMTDYRDIYYSELEENTANLQGLCEQKGMKPVTVRKDPKSWVYVCYTESPLKHYEFTQ